MSDPPFRLDRYLPERLLGAGSFATVWLARDKQLGAWVALKVLADNWSLDDEVIQRFLEEARILHRLDHPRFVRVLNVDHLPDGRPYFAMEYADRGSLQQRLDERSEPFSVAEALDIGLDITNCLVVAHDLNVVHRDLKPSNLLYRTTPEHRRLQLLRSGRTAPEEEMMLADFGLARLLDRAAGHTIAAGTPLYMAPEQTLGRADLRSDIYSAAAVLHHVLTGRPRFGHVSIADVTRVTEAPPPMIGDIRPGVPLKLERLVRDALHPDPDHRPQSASDLLAALREINPRRRASRKMNKWSRLARRFLPAPRGRPILGTGSGLLIGLGLGLLGQQFGLWPPDALALVVVPSALALAGNAWGRWAPVGRRRWWKAQPTWPANTATTIMALLLAVGIASEWRTPPSGSLSPECSLLASSGRDTTTVNDTSRTNPFAIDPGGTLVLDSVMERAPGEGAWHIWLEIAGLRIPVASRTARFRATAAVVVDLQREIDRYLVDRRLLPTGLWVVAGTLEGTDLSCWGRAYVRVLGSPFSTVFGFLTIGLLVVGGGVGFAAGIRRR